jgi:hypothetical protein
MQLTLQQLPYDCPDPSFEFRDPSDVLERVFGRHDYECNQKAQLTVPSNPLQASKIQ